MIKQRHPGSGEDIIHGMAIGLGHMESCGGVWHSFAGDGRQHTAMGSTCGRVAATNK